MHLFSFIHKKYLLAIAVFAFVLFLFLAFGARDLMQIDHLKEEREKALLKNTRLKEENKKLEDQIRRMQTHKKEEVEKFAREELGMVKKGEVLYKFE